MLHTVIAKKLGMLFACNLELGAWCKMRRQIDDMGVNNDAARIVLVLVAVAAKKMIKST